MITSSSKLSIYGLVPTLVTLRFEIGQPLGCQGGNFLVATAKSEDGFRKAQQLTEEATEETPHAVDRGMSLYLGPKHSTNGKPLKPRLCRHVVIYLLILNLGPGNIARPICIFQLHSQANS